MLQKDATAARSFGNKSGAMQSVDKVFALDAGQAGHMEIC
jgi:hypothetical protein